MGLSDTVAINPITEYNIKSNPISPFLKGYRIDYMDDYNKSNIYPRAYTEPKAIEYKSHINDLPLANGKPSTSSAMEYLQSKEGKDNTYTTKNMAGSSAYGKYQFMPDTAKMYADQLGLSEYTSPEAQEKIMARALNDYKSKLNKWGVQQTNGNIYAIHQLGPSRAYRMFNGTLTSNDVKVMKDNLPRGSNTLDVVKKWKELYL